jgi:tetratricopeptide (TPR) repeat protein
MSGGGTFAHHDDAARLAAMIAAGKSPALAAAALPEAKRILAGDPAYLPALAVSALALEKGADPSAAAEAYENILVQDPIFSPATRELALIYAQQPGAEQKAYDMAVKAREAFPEDPAVATALGIADYRRKDYEGAVRLLGDSLRLRADDAETTYYLGLSHLNLRQAPKAKAELKHALELGLPGGEAGDAKSALAGIK